MKAATYSNYGPPEVLQITDTPKPVPKKNELLIKISYSAVTAADLRIRAARFPQGFAPFARMVFGIRKPRRKILGSCFSGTVEQVGADVAGFTIGDEVCGMNSLRFGAYAQHVTIPYTKSVVKKPKNVPHETAAAMLFGGSAALFFIRDKAKVTKGHHMLINGAAGAVGSHAVQLAKHYGAQVDGIASSKSKHIVQDCGADTVYSYEDQPLETITSTYDVVLDTVGNLSIKRHKKLLQPNGKLVLMVASLPQMLHVNKSVVTGTATEKPEDLTFLLGLCGSNDLRPIIDSTYTLAHIVEAHKRAESRDKNGVVLIDMRS